VKPTTGFLVSGARGFVLHFHVSSRHLASPSKGAVLRVILLLCSSVQHKYVSHSLPSPYRQTTTGELQGFQFQFDADLQLSIRATRAEAASRLYEYHPALVLSI